MDITAHIFIRRISEEQFIQNIRNSENSFNAKKNGSEGLLLQQGIQFISLPG